MKKLVLLFAIGLGLLSCSLNGDEPNFEYRLLPVTEVNMPSRFAKDSTTNISVKYKLPSNCYYFNNFYYKTEDNIRTVAIEAIKSSQTNCVDDNLTVYESNLKFVPKQTGTYHFKFWTGTNSNTIDQYIEYDVVVNH